MEMADSFLLLREVAPIPGRIVISERLFSDQWHGVAGEKQKEQTIKC